MARHEIRFPTGIDYGSSGGPGHNTVFLDSKGGAQSRVGRWGTAIRTWEVGNTVKTPEQILELQEFVIGREGGLHSFRFKDWADYSTDATRRGAPDFEDVILGVGDGTTTQFQLVTKYTSGPSTRTRTIQAPVSGTVVAGVAGVAGAVGVDWTVDTTTGIVTFASAPGVGEDVTAGCEFDCIGHFGPGSDALLSIRIDSCTIRSIPSLTIVEDPSTEPVMDEYLYGDGDELAFSIPTQVTPLTGRALTLTPGAATDLILPSAAQQPLGGPHFFLSNAGAHTITIKSGGSTVATLAAGAIKTVCVFPIGGVNTWKAF